MTVSYITPFLDDANRTATGPSQPVDGVPFADLAKTIPGEVAHATSRMVVIDVGGGHRVCVSSFAFS